MFLVLLTDIVSVSLRIREAHIINISLIRFRSHFIMLTDYMDPNLPSKPFDNACVRRYMVVTLTIQFCGYTLLTPVGNIHNQNAS